MLVSRFTNMYSPSTEYKFDVPAEYKEEWHQMILRLNLNRERIFCFILIAIIILLFCLDTAAKRLLGLHSSIFLEFSYIHIVLLMIPTVFLILHQIIPMQKKFLHIHLNVLVLTICSLIAIYNAMAGQQPFAYIIAVFCISSAILFSTFERILVLSFPFAFYTVGIILFHGEIKDLLANIFFVAIMTVIAFIISEINYFAFLKGFINNKTIIKQNRELDILCNTTRTVLKERTKELNDTVEYEKLRTAFFANISHELRTPLTIIFSAEQMLDFIFKNNQLTNNKEVNYYMHMIRQNCCRLIRIIANLIDITKIDAGYFQVYLKNNDIVKIVEDISLSVAKFIEDKNISLTFDTEIEEKVIACDPDKIERIMLNLLSNAVKFTPQGGDIFVNLHEKDGSIIISVRDTGIGIPNDMKNLIFEKFVQVNKSTTRNTEGSGIGLSLVKSLVEMHGGTISLESEVGKGSNFIIMLPDRTVPDVPKTEDCNFIREGQNIEKINIEFSDIYN